MYNIMPKVNNFSVFTSNLDLGNVSENIKVFNSNQSSRRTSSTIIDLYDKSHENENVKLVGKTLWNNTCTIHFSPKSRYSQSTNTFFLKNGTIETSLNTLNWEKGQRLIATIHSGTGEYLGVTGFVEIVVIDRKLDENVDAWDWTCEYKFIFL